MTKLRDSILSTLTSRIQHEIGNKLGNKTSSGWSLIPNCSWFNIDLKGDDAFMKEIGLPRNLKPEIEIIPHRNKPMNKYLKYQLNRLERNINNPKIFWTVSWFLMKHSIVFRISAINHVLPTWYKQYPLWEIFRYNRKVDKIINEENYKLEYHRHYIPKGEKDFRPLGIPTIPWRIFLHMLNNFLYMYLKPHLLDSQHGFIPGRGTLSAWKEIFEKVIDSEYIYECDLKQFFPSVHVNEISRVLEEHKVPKKWVYYIENINRQIPILPDKTDQVLDESKYELNEQDHKDLMAGIFRWESPMYDGVRDFVKHNGWECYYEVCGPNIMETVQEQWALLDMYKPAKVPGHFEGTPQGAPTSPLLSIITLKSFLQQTPSVSYADDPVFYSDTDFSIKDEPDKGIIIHPEKSRWVKRNGEWLVDKFKFLGLEYIPSTNSLRSSTRKGETVEMSCKWMRGITEKLEPKWLEEFYKTLEPKTPYHGKSWYNLISRRIGGLIQSRLYNGKWEKLELEQDFKLKIGSYSWASHTANRYKDYPTFLNENNIFNISSFASESLYYMLEGYKRKRENKRIRRVLSFTVNPRGF